MFGHKIQQWKDGAQTRKCRAITPGGPCGNFTYYEFCHAHEWRFHQQEMATHQSYVHIYPRVVARLVRVIDEPDSEVALKGIMVYLKYLVGEKTVLEGLPKRDDGLADMTNEQLVERAQRAIAALQAPPTGAPDGLETAQDSPETAQDSPVAANGGQPDNAQPGAQQTGSETLEMRGNGNGVNAGH